MITYEITATVDPGSTEAYEQFMRQRHIPDLLATGYFREAAFTRSAPGRYRVRYEASSHADLERYLAEHAPQLRADFAAHFPSGVTLSREIWATIQTWNAPAHTVSYAQRGDQPMDAGPGGRSAAPGGEAEAVQARA